MKKPDPDQRWLSLKRWERNQRRKDKGYSPYGGGGKSAFVLSIEARHVLSSFRKRNNYLRSRFASNENFLAPKRFCLIENPVESLKYIQKIASAAGSDDVLGIEVDESGCTHVGLSAEVILSCVLEAADKNKKKLRGRLPEDDEIVKKAWTVGSPSLIGDKAEVFNEKYKDIIKTRQRVTARMYEGQFRNDEVRNQAILDIVKYFNSCLVKQCDMELNGEGRQRIVEYLGEVTENAETHARMLDWAVSGYFGLIDGIPTCEISISNFGISMADSFLELKPGDVARQDVDHYVSLHKNQGLFEAAWNPEALATVVALQEGVSRLLQTDPLRGNGTGELIEFFQVVSDNLRASGKCASRPEMSLISGSTYIYFDGFYRLNLGSNGKKIISFNREGSLERPPDKKYVQYFNDAYFPGTVFSLRFSLPDAFRQELS